MMTVGLVLSLPHTGIGRRGSPAVAAAVGVAVLIATRIVSPVDLAAALEILWRPFLTILSIMLTTSVAQQLGILDYFAKLLELGPNRSVGRVFRSVFIFSAATSALLNNDAAVLLLTPLIVGLVRPLLSGSAGPHRPFRTCRLFGSRCRPAGHFESHEPDRRRVRRNRFQR